MNKFNLAIISRVLLLLVIVVLLDSCKAKRDITPVSDVLLRSAQSLVSSMHQNHADFDFFSTRFSGSALIENQNYNISGNMRIHKDEAIYISIAPILGIEVARILITPDTVKVVNRLEGTFFVGDMGFINKMLNTDLDFYMVQAFLIGNDFEHFNINNFRVMEDRGRVLLHSPSRGKLPGGYIPHVYEHNLYLDEHSFRIHQNVLYEPVGKRTIRANYRNFVSVGGQILPANFSLEFVEPSAKAELSIQYNRTVLNNPQQMSFSIPERYVPMSF